RRPDRQAGNRRGPWKWMRPRIVVEQAPKSGWHIYARSFCTLPLAGDPEQESQLALACGYHLNVELIDEQKRHAGFQIVKQGLQRRLLEFAIRDHADEAGLGVRALQVKLGRQHI